MTNFKNASGEFQRIEVSIDRATDVRSNQAVLRIILARPEVRNAFDAKTIDELTDVFSKAGREGPYRDARVVLLSGHGKSFCAGADLEYMKSMAKYSHDENLNDGKRLFAMFDAVRTCEVPVVVHAHGHAMGGAVGLAACADIAFAETGTEFRFSEVRLGIVPAVISAFVLTKMSPLWARRWMITGELFTAEEALSAGLLHFVGTSEEVVREKEMLVKAILEAGPDAVKTTKRLLNEVGSQSPNQMRAKVVGVIADVRASLEGQEGLAAFLEKRDPAWRVNK